MIANMIQTQFLQLSNAPLGAALSVLAMMVVGAIAIAFVLLNRRFLGARR
jgi:spermidine/putrescine transport system permease protein